MSVESVGLVVHGCFYCRWMVDWVGWLVVLFCSYLSGLVVFCIKLSCIGWTRWFVNYLLILIVQTDKENYIDFRLRLLGEPGDPHNDNMLCHMSL